MKSIYFAVFITETGEVVRSGRCSIDDVDLQIKNEFESVIAKDFPISPNSYIKNGLIIGRGDRPSESHEWSAILKEWVINQESLRESVIGERNSILASTDWTQLQDVPLKTKSEWATYRQALRDITDQPGFPESVLWPDQP